MAFVLAAGRGWDEDDPIGRKASVACAALILGLGGVSWWAALTAINAA